MTNTEELEKLIKASGLKKSYIAEQLGITRQSFASKCRNESAFSATHITILCDLLGVKTLTKKDQIFFVR